MSSPSSERTSISCSKNNYSKDVLSTSEIQVIKQRLLSWESSFKANHGRKPSKDEIKQNMDIYPLYIQYRKLKEETSKIVTSTIVENQFTEPLARSESVSDNSLQNVTPGTSKRACELKTKFTSMHVKLWEEQRAKSKAKAIKSKIPKEVRPTSVFSADGLSHDANPDSKASRGKEVSSHCQALLSDLKDQHESSTSIQEFDVSLPPSAVLPFCKSHVPSSPVSKILRMVHTPRRGLIASSLPALQLETNDIESVTPISETHLARHSWDPPDSCVVSNNLLHDDQGSLEVCQKLFRDDFFQFHSDAHHGTGETDQSTPALRRRKACFHVDDGSLERVRASNYASAPQAHPLDKFVASNSTKVPAVRENFVRLQSGHRKRLKGRGSKSGGLKPFGFKTHRSIRPGSRRCFHCGRPGHWAQQCPQQGRGTTASADGEDSLDLVADRILSTSSDLDASQVAVAHGPESLEESARSSSLPPFSHGLQPPATGLQQGDAPGAHLQGMKRRKLSSADFAEEISFTQALVHPAGKPTPYPSSDVQITVPHGRCEDTDQRMAQDSEALPLGPGIKGHDPLQPLDKVDASGSSARPLRPRKALIQNGGVERRKRLGKDGAEDAPARKSNPEDPSSTLANSPRTALLSRSPRGRRARARDRALLGGSPVRESGARGGHGVESASAVESAAASDVDARGRVEVLAVASAGDARRDTGVILESNVQGRPARRSKRQPDGSCPDAGVRVPDPPSLRRRSCRMAPPADDGLALDAPTQGAHLSEQSCATQGATGSAVDWSQGSYDNAHLQDALVQLTGHREFRAGQEQAMRRVLSGQSTLLVAPTGGGKSLCYQLPARLLPGTVLVISPLLSLMEDQLCRLPAGLRGAAMGGQRSFEEYQATAERLRAGDLDVLFVAPERLFTDAFLALASKLPAFSLVCLDEAHCLSEWAHNFRPSYLRLRSLLRCGGLRTRCVLGLTATATRPMEREIAEALGIEADGVVRADLQRPNLRLTVSRDQHRQLAVLDMLQRDSRFSCGPVLVYCALRAQCEDLARYLTGHSVVADYYHAGRAVRDRQRVQQRFAAGRVRVVVATVAFGMGLDKSDVRGVIHYSCPNSLESYAQEVGRAGRDGRPAHCHLFLQDEDLSKARSLAHGEGVDESNVRRLLDTLFEGGAAGKLVQLDEDSAAGYDMSKEGVETVLCFLERLGLVEVCNSCAARGTLSVLTPQADQLRRSSPALSAVTGLHAARNGQWTFSPARAASAAGLASVASLARELRSLKAARLIRLEWAGRASLCRLLPPALAPGAAEKAAAEICRRLEALGRRRLGRLGALSRMLSWAAQESWRSAGPGSDGLPPPAGRPDRRGLDGGQEACATPECPAGRSPLRQAGVQDGGGEELGGGCPLARALADYFSREGADEEEDEAGAGGELDAVVADDHRFLRGDVINFVRMSAADQPLLTGRAVARIFHGVQSPAFPAKVWARSPLWGLSLRDVKELPPLPQVWARSPLWGRYSTSPFPLIQAAAHDAITALRGLAA